MSRRTFCSALLLIALTLLAYAPAMHGGFIWDDDDYVTANPNLRLSGGLADIWLAPSKSPQYYPLVYTTFWIEHQLWDFNAAGYHVDNILLQALAAILLWRLLEMLEIPAAFLAACIFSIHPLQAESVVWITERKNVLCGVFYFASALCFVAWASRPSEKNSGETPKQRKAISRIGAFLFCLRNAEQNRRLLAAGVAGAAAVVEKRSRHVAAMAGAAADVPDRPGAGHVHRVSGSASRRGGGAGMGVYAGRSNSHRRPGGLVLCQ